MTLTTLHAKNTKNISQEVKQILQEKGFSFLFNWNDYNYYKNKAKTAFNKAQAIAEMFINDNTDVDSDFNQYIF